METTDGTPQEYPADGTRLVGVRRRPYTACLLYTSDAADDLLCVDLVGRRLINKKNTTQHIHILTKTHQMATCQGYIDQEHNYCCTPSSNNLSWSCTK